MAFMLLVEHYAEHDVLKQSIFSTRAQYIQIQKLKHKQPLPQCTLGR